MNFMFRFHPWKKINPENVYNAPTVQEILVANFTDEEVSFYSKLVKSKIFNVTFYQYLAQTDFRNAFAFLISF